MNTLKSEQISRFLFRMPLNLRRKLDREAKNKNQSLNQYLCNVLNDHARTKVEDPVLQTLRTLYPEGLLGIVLFGSVARGTEKETSDIDLLLVFDPSITIDRELYRRFQDPKLSIHCVTKISSNQQEIGSLWCEIALDGKILWDPKNEIENLLQSIRARIAEGDFQKLNSNGHGYWKAKGHAK